jgi:hypothetical protein
VTDIVLAPRLEDPTSDVEPIVSTGWQYRIRVARTRTDSGQWVLPEWPMSGGWKQFTGVAETLKLDALDAIPYELEIQGPLNAATRSRPTVHEYRFVKTSTSSGAKWETLDAASGPGGDPALPSGDQVRLTNLEAAIGSVSGGASTLSAISGISADGKTLIGGTKTFAQMRSDLGAAAASHTHDAGDLATGTVAAARLPSATTSAVGVVELATTAEALAGVDTVRAVTPAGLAAVIASLGTIVSVPTTTGLTLRYVYRTTDVSAARPTVTAGISIDWEVPGDTAPTNIRWDLGDVWTSVYS